MIPEATIDAVGQANQNAWLTFAAQFYIIMQPFIWPLIAALLGWGITILKKHGYQTTYATAIVRAAGAGVAEAQRRGLDPFSPAGRGVVVAIGAEYLKEKVGVEGAKLGIDTLAQHGERVSAQLGVVVGQAVANAQAVATTLPGSLSEVASGQGNLSILGGH